MIGVAELPVIYCNTFLPQASLTKQDKLQEASAAASTSSRPGTTGAEKLQSKAQRAQEDEDELAALRRMQQ